MNILLRYLFLSIFLISYQSSFAQHTHTMSFDEVYPFSGHSYYNTLKVIDQRVDKSSLGYLTKAMHDRLIVTEKRFDEELSLYFEKVLKASKDTPGNQQLLMVVYDVMLEDKSGNNSLKTFLFSADFYAGHDTGYSFLGAVDTFSPINERLVLSKKEFLEQSLENMFAILNKYAQVKPTQVPLCAETDLVRRRSDEKQNFEIYRTGVTPKKGIYYTPEQFLNNTPVDTPIVITEAAPGEMLVYYKNTIKDKRGPIVKSKTYFAAYDGKTLVASVSGAPFDSRMILQDGDFIATRYCFKTYAHNSHVVPAAFGVFGIAGAIIGSSIKVKGCLNYNARFNPHKKLFVPMRKYDEPEN